MYKLFSGKRGDEKTFPAMLLLKLIFAIALVLLVLWFGSKIWASLFPSTDAATTKSFDTLVSTLQLKIANNQFYDSSFMSLYLKKDYHVLFFGPGDKVKCGNFFQTKIYVLKPDVCNTAQYCLCLYKDAPISGTDANPADPKTKNDNVVKCTEVKPRANVVTTVKQFDLVNDNCYRVNTNQFQPIIIAENSINTNKQDLYVWQDTPDSRAKDAAYKKISCQSGDPVCFGRTEGLITGDSSLFQKVLSLCISRKVETLSATCKIDAGSTSKCSVVCSNDAIQCPKIKSCSDYAKYADDGTMTGTFITKNSAAEYACNNDPSLCHKFANGCMTFPADYFICDKSKTDCSTEFGKITQNDKDACKITSVGTQSSKFMPVAYDQSIIGCDTLFKKYTAFIPAQAYQLNWDNGQELIQNSKLMSDCDFEPLGSGLYVSLSGQGIKDCTDAIAKYFSEVEDCKAR